MCWWGGKETTREIRGAWFKSCRPPRIGGVCYIFFGHGDICCFFGLVGLLVGVPTRTNEVVSASDM